MKDDQKRWDQRFTDKPLLVPESLPYFEQALSQCARGAVLDVASGDGAVALAFARAGFKVCAVDISGVALLRLRTFAEQEQLSVQCVCLDLDDVAGIEALGIFDTIVIARFKPSLVLLNALARCLAPGGQLLLTTFNLAHHQATGFSRRFCLAPAELVAACAGLDCVSCESVERDGSFMDEYRFVRSGL